MSYKRYQGTAFAESLLNRRPSIAGWNRLEGQPRSKDLARSLAYEICDPLWMLTCQLRTGELRGEDSGSPVFAKIKFSTSPLDQVRIGIGPVEPLDDRLPIEARVEREHPRPDLRFALESGRLWMLHLAHSLAEGELSRDFRSDFVAAYPIGFPADDVSNVDRRAHQPVLELYAAAAGRAIDGSALYTACGQWLAGSGSDPLDALASPPSGADRAAMAQQLEAWRTALRARYSLDDRSDGGGWQPAALTYSLSCSAPGFGEGGRVALRADEYCRGHLDWYSFDVAAADDPVAAPLDDAVQSGSIESHTRTFVPTALRFAGMPAPRLWEFENRKTNFGKITAYTTDLARLMLVEFGLVFGNDWFLFPIETEAGRIVQVDGLVVTDSFGERSWIPAYGQSSGRSWERWGVFANASAASGPPGGRMLLMADTIDTMLESAPIEDVTLFRDEVANMVFGVERRIALDDGHSIDGFEAFQARRRYYDRATEGGLVPAQEDRMGAPVSYRLMNDELPENWIPFVPVQMLFGDNREIQLQRAAMLRMQGGSEAERVVPRTRILRPDPHEPYFIHEEQVPRTGVRIAMTYQRTRHHSGRPVLWCGRSKRIGSGEGSSGLMFDRIES